MNTFGKNIRISLFGESHGSHIGVTIDGLPCGIKLDEELIKKNLLARQGIRQISTNRKENENYEIISGYYNNQTTGTPLTFIIKNIDIDSSSYINGVVRPNHSDYPYYIKYDGCNDFRGGGHSSGRLTALLVIVGSICQQILNGKKIFACSHLHQTLNIKDEEFNDDEKINMIKQFDENRFMLSAVSEEKVKTLIQETKLKSDSLPSKVETLIEGVEVGVGEPFFDSFESILSHLLFSIPAVKGVFFGDEDITNNLGSQKIDELHYQNDEVVLLSNHQGGLSGGLTNGNIIKFYTSFKAPSSTMTPKKSIDILKKENIIVQTQGRHDPIIGIRAIPVINAISYYAILELLMENKKHEIFR